MGFKSNKRSVLSALTDAEDKALTAIGEYTKGLGIASSPVGQYTDGRVGGNMRDSHDYQVQGHKMILGNNAEYSVFVHEGTINQSSQPWLRKSVMQNVSNIKSLVGRYMKL